MKILVTGCAGFIGSNLVDRLLAKGHEVIGVDNFNDYYSPKIKEANLKRAKSFKNFKLYRVDILNLDKLKAIFKRNKITKIVHLAARAGVRPSIANPFLYAQVNVLGTTNLLKLAIDFAIKQFIYGSSSSVYGSSKKIPFNESSLCQNIISPYGASKRSAELFIENFHKTYGLNAIILRLFTVYGPRGRPDMAPALFTNAILSQKPIDQFGDGSSKRDYTYIDDIINGIMKALENNLRFEIINLGSNHPVTLKELIANLEKIIAKKAKIDKLPKQPGDVKNTWANIKKAKKLLGWTPQTKLEDGLYNYVDWYRAVKTS